VKRVVWWVVALAVGVYLLPGVLLYFMQEASLFPAPRLPRAALDAVAKQVGATPLSLTAADGVQLYAWHRSAGERPPGVVLFFHGNAEAVMDRQDLHQLVLHHGWDVVVPAYRGYPGSEGRPSEAGLRLDALAAWDWVTGTLGVPPERVVVHGKSLGGGVAAMLVEEVTPAALVLESTFTSVADVAARQFPIYPVRLLVRHPFDTRARASRIEVPVLVLHGDADDVIAVRHGRALSKLFPDVRYVEVAGVGHQETLPAVDARAREAYLALLTPGAGSPP
jgi:fermentation-respiration switch protein FrsA (DUF1100 family)